MNNYIIKTEQLTKKYKSFVAVNDVSLHIRKREYLWLLRSERCRKIHYNENAFRAYCPDKRQL